MKQEKNTAIVLAAGQGKRMNSRIQKQFLEMIAGDDYSPEALKEMASYVKKNGLKIYGFTTIADKDTLLKLSKQSEVYEIYTEELN